MLKKELGQLKTKLEEEDKEKAEAHIQAKEKEDNLRNSVKALVGTFCKSFNFSFLFDFINFLFLFAFL
jgi:hypothetical protein